MVYIKHILNYLVTGISWNGLELFIDNITGDAIRKKFNKWVRLNIFKKAYEEFLTMYQKCNGVKLHELFMDVTVFKNFNCKADITGFCRKLPNKRSTKANLICDENKIGIAIRLQKSNEHDSKYIEETLNHIPNIVSDTFSYNKPCIMTADKGYVIDKQRRNNMRKTQHVSMNTPLKKNMKKRNKTIKNKELLKKRIKVEHLNCRILRTFKGISTMKYNNLIRLESLFKLAFTMQIFEYMYENNLSKISQQHLIC